MPTATRINTTAVIKPVDLAIRYVGKFERPEHHEFKQEGVEHADGCRFCRAEDTPVYAADDNDREKQGPQCLTHGYRSLTPGRLLLGWEVVDASIDQAIDREHQQNHDARPDTRNEQFRNGRLGDNPVDNETDARGIKKAMSLELIISASENESE